MRSFAETLYAALLASDKSLGNVVRELKQRGYPLDKSTLSRWVNGATQPSVKHMGLLRCLPEVLGMSPDDQAAFFRSLNHWLDIKGSVPGSAPLPFRQVTLGQLLNFTGRDAELQHLKQVIGQRRSVAITGMGGIGKTTLAQRLLQLSAHQFTSGCEACALHSGQTAAEVIAQVAHRLGLNFPTQAQSAADLELLDWLADHAVGIDLLFLLDDVSTELQVAPLIRRLPNITWVLTSRRPLTISQVDNFSLDVPPDDEAACLLLTHIGLSANPNEVDRARQITERLGNLPLAISCAAGLALLFNSDLTAVLNWLKTDGLDALRLQYAHLPRFFAQMLADRTPAVNTLFAACGAFALPRISSAIFQKLAERLQLHLAGLLVLSDISLIGWPEGKDYFVLHPLVHEYAALRLRSAPRSLEIQQHFSQHYAQLAQEWRHTGNEDELIDELENVLRAADYAYESHDWVCFRLFWSPITHRLWLNGDKQRYVIYDMRFLEVARLQGDRPNQAQILSELGWVQIELGELAAAEQLLQDSLVLCDSLPDSDLQRARALRYQAKVAVKRHDSTQALDLLNTAKNALINLGTQADRIALAHSLVCISQAKIAFVGQHREQARTAALAALDYCQRAGIHGQGYLPGICVDVGDILYEYEEQFAAEQLWQRAAAVKPEIAEDAGVAIALTRLAYLAAVRDQKEEALNQARRALEIYLQRGLLRYHRRLGEWLKNYENHAEIGPLLDLARLED